MKKRLLIIEDEKITRTLLQDILSLEGYEVHTAVDGEEGLQLFRTVHPSIVITDLRLPKQDGISVLTEILSADPLCKVILITAYASVDTAVRSLKIGAYDYLTKPFSPDKLIAILRNIEQLQSVLQEGESLRSGTEMNDHRPLIGASPALERVLQTVRQVAHSDSTVLIDGESGTGKEVVARALHDASARRNGPFVAVSVANIPESLLESELFGHEKGSFTGAVRQHIGYFERAHGGTLFIDDIDDFPLTVQVKLLRVIQERELTHVGGKTTVPINVRIVCATKIDLRMKVDEGTFREDLFYRLNIIPLRLPPLRERKEDIPLLVEHFFRKHKAEDKIMFLTQDLLDELKSYDWPGNVRELENIVERMITLSFSGSIDRSVIGLDRSAHRTGPKEEFTRYGSYDAFLQAQEVRMLEWAMAQTGNNVTEAAKLLHLPRTTLSSKLARLLPKLPTQ